MRPRVVSGDKDGLIFVWDVGMELRGTSKDVTPTTRFEGHTATVEDVCFKPDSHTEVCSVGDDQLLLFWDERSGTSPVLEVPKWSTVDLHCVDWNHADVNLLVTGARCTRPGAAVSPPAPRPSAQAPTAGGGARRHRGRRDVCV